MRQINLLPSGCLKSDQTVVYASDRKLIFTSKMALYVLNPITFGVEKIISTQARGTISISVSPHNDNLVACSGIDGTLCVWNLATESCERRLQHPADILAWDPHDPSNCAIILNSPKIQLFSWDIREAVCTTKRLFVADSDTVIANVARWNPHVVGQLAIGGSNGVVYLYDAQLKKSKSLKVKDRATSIVDLQWDRLSSVYMIAAYQVFISLWDTETSTEVHIFEKQSTGISSLAWLDWTAGNFISANVKTGVIKVWNASQKQPLESIRVHTEGITSMHFSPGSSRMMCSAVDGSVLVYHMLKHQLEYVSSAGHTDTIFDCVTSPQNPNVFCTCSYDTTVKIWNIADLSLKKTLHGADGIVYSCSWSPNSKRIAASTVAGNVLIFDAETSRVLATFSYHDKASYCVKWNPEAENLILSTSADCYAVVITLDLAQLDESSTSKNGAIGSRRKKNTTTSAGPISLVRFSHPKGVFGCDWCPQSPKTFATACQDGLIRIWKYAEASATTILSPVYILESHRARVFSVVWSPLITGLLASGSDDQTILIWEVPVLAFPTESDLKEITLSPVRRLEGHTSNVRALTWNYEHRLLLLSGSWDATMRIWNVATGSVLQIISDHVADIYTITSHPMRPFTYISCSRDSTLRIWEFEGIQTVLRMKVLINGNLGAVLPSAEDIASSADMPPGNLLTALSSSTDACLWGKVSRSLLNQFQITAVNSPRTIPSSRNVRGTELAQKYRLIYDYFCGANGSVNLWDCVIAYCMNQNKSDRADMRFNALTFSGDIHQEILKNTAIPADLILGIARSNARQLESSKNGLRRGDFGVKVEECLRLAALKYAQTGDFLKYCSLLVEIGDWTGALAMAPCVSLEFWQKLMSDYAQHLENNLSEDCVPYYIGIGHDRSAVDFYLSRNDSSSAMIVAKMSQQRTDLIPDLEFKKREDLSKKDSFGTSIAQWRGPRNESFRERTDTEDEKSTKLIRQVILHLVENTLHQAKPISSAAYLVSIGEIQAAIYLLSLCGESDLAFAIADCCSMDPTEYIKQMAEKAESLDKLDVSADILSCLPPDVYQAELDFLALRHSQHESMAQFHLKDKQVSLRNAEEAKAIGHDDEAITAYLLGGDHNSAAKLGMKRIARHILEPFQISPVGKKILHVLRNINVQCLEEQSKAIFLSYIFWFGAHRAIQLGFWDVACGMLGILSNISKDTEFPISSELIKYHELCVRMQCCSIGTEKLFVELLQNAKNDIDDAQKEVIPIIKRLRALHNDVRTTISSNGFDPYDPEYSRCFSPTALLNKPIYGNLTGQIESEIRNISTILRLPVLPSTLPDPPAGVSSIFNTSYGTSVLNSLKGIPAVVQGSILPVANQKLKIQRSYITGQVIQGPLVNLDDNSSFISVNEAIMWKMVNPYSPLGNGAFLGLR